MTRRERAAMALALEVLRGGPESDERCSCHGGVVHAPDGLVPCNACDGHGIIVDPFVRHMIWSADILLAEDACAPVTVEAWEAVAVQADEGGEAEQRLIRARLALYLRARLRAEGREEVGFGRWACVDCGSGDLRHPWIEPGPRCRSCGGNDIDYTCRITPLWQQAPAHGGGA